MKNVIVIICDSLCYDENFYDDMPNLAKYKENTINFTNYFSQAPYTEAAIVPIFSASNVLDEDGYLYNLKDRKYNINEIFKLLGYKTYNTLWFYPNTLSFMRGLDEYDYVDSFSINYYLVAYRIEYFKKVYSKNKFSKKHLEMIVSLLDNCFDMLNIYIKDYRENRYRFNLLLKYSNFKEYDMQKLQDNIIKENKLYLKNKEEYITNLLTGKNTFFNKEEFEIYEGNGFNHKSFKLNILNTRLMIKQFFYALKNTRLNQSISTLKHTIGNLGNPDEILNSIKRWIYYTINYPGKYRYKMFSANILISNLYEYLIKNKKENNFMVCHLMDTHTPFNFFTREKDMEKDMIKFMSKRKNFSKEDNNFYRYAKRYLDIQIDTLIKKLKDDNLWDNTTIIITSDHGSSFLGKINRTEITSTFFEENYRIPFIIMNKDIKETNVNKLSISTQFIPTILDFIGIEGYDDLKKNSILIKDNDYIIYEYYGSGCPDFTTRDMKFCIKNHRYKIICDVPINVPINKIKDTIKEIYDLKKDPNELINIKSEAINDSNIGELLVSLEKRINEIKCK